MRERTTSSAELFDTIREQKQQNKFFCCEVGGEHTLSLSPLFFNSLCLELLEKLPLNNLPFSGPLLLALQVNDNIDDRFASDIDPPTL